MALRILAILLLLVSYSARAEDLEVTKQPEPETGRLMKLSTATFDYRYYYLQVYDSQNELADETITQQPRATVGFTFFDSLSASLALAVSKRDDNQQFIVRQPQLVLSLPLLKGENWELAGVVENFFEYENRARWTEVGVSPTWDKKLNSEWALAFWGEAEIISTGDTSARVNNYERNIQRFTLAPGATEDDPYINGVRKDPNYQTNAELLVKYVPGQLNGKMTIAAGVWFNTMWTPEYAYNEQQDRVETSYADQSYSINRLRIDYALNKNLTLTEDFYYTVAGFYDAPSEGSTHTLLGRMTNMVRLSYSLL